ncbi:glycosyltransferase family 2 protein, partial [Candidatus Uhrbacteria bacterium]|nr:glycosyltransferase family 2 protein [Candidatus Uhrbacteria bacterium]
MQSNITIIVPVYNEQHTVIMLLEKLLSVFKNTGVTFQIIVVDDGSTDDTKKLLLAFQENHAHDSFTLMSHAHNKGKGAAIHTALEHAQGEYTIIQDADMEYDPSDIIALYSYAQQKNLPVLYGSRNKAKNERGQFFFYWGGRLVSLVTNVLFRQRLTDEATCYKLMNTKLLQSFPLHERGFAFCPEVTAHIAKQGIRIEEMAIAYVPRSKGHGKKINWSDGIKALWVLFQLRFPNIKTHLLVCALVTTAVLLYSTTWHKLFEGYEGETANAALKLFDGAYDVKRAGISAVLLYLPFVFLFRLFGMTSVSHLTIVPVIYSAMTIGLFFSIVWYLTKKKSISLIVSLLIMSGSLVWPYANIGMEYQVMFYLALMLFLLLRWKEGKGKLLWVAIVFALLSTAKSYGPIFGLPVVLFIFSVSARDRTKRALSVITPAAVVFVLSSAYSWYTRGSIVGVYSLSHEFQIWTWWEGFYGIFFSIGKGIF